MTERPIFDSIAPVYDETRNLPDDIMDSVTDIIVSLLGRDSDLLDVGVGTGRFAIPLTRKGMDVTGIDISRGMMERCREKGFGRMLMASVERMPFRDGSFDNALMVHVLHLMDDWKGALAEVCRVTRHNIVSVISQWPEEDWPGIYYGTRVDELGYGPSHPGKFERELGRLVPPTRRVPTGSFRRHRDNDSFINLLENRQMSSATKLPDDLHAMVVSETRERYGGGSQDLLCQVDIFMWDAQGLSKSLLNIGH